MFPRSITTFLCTGSLALCASVGHAQVSFGVGPRAGLNLATYHFERPPYGTTAYRPGLEAGLQASIGFGHVALQPALLYSQKGFRQRTSVDIRTGTNLPVGTGEQQYSHLFNYLTLPLNVAYTQHADGQGLQVFAGPYLGLLLSGRYENTITLNGSTYASESGKITPVDGDAPDFGYFFHRWDAGLQGGAGYRYQSLLFQLTYSMGLRSVSAPLGGTGTSASAFYNRAFQASLAYLFSSSK